MRAIRKRIVTDEQAQPVAVQIDYADWLQIEKELGLRNGGAPSVALEHFRGAIRLSEDPVAYQDRIRGEW